MDILTSLINAHSKKNLTGRPCTSKPSHFARLSSGVVALYKEKGNLIRLLLKNSLIWVHIECIAEGYSNTFVLLVKLICYGPPDKSVYSKLHFLSSQPKHGQGTQKNSLTETVLLSTQNKLFR